MSINRILVPIVLVLALLLILRQAGAFATKPASIPTAPSTKPVVQQTPPPVQKPAETPAALPVTPSAITLPYKIAFISGRDHAVKKGSLGYEYTYELYIMDVDGKQKRITSGEGYSSNGSPLWSPDGKNIALLDTIISADGKNLWNIQAAVGSWSPDGTMIAYIYKGDICTSAVDGSNERRLTNNYYNFEEYQGLTDGSQLSWSPDSTKIICQKYSGLYVVDADGGLQVRLTDMYSGRAIWSPDSTRIVFTGHYPEALFVINKNINTDPVEIYYGLAAMSDPVWSPDSQKIVFSAKEPNRKKGDFIWDYANNNFANIYVVNADGSNKRQLTDNTMNYSNPDWSPDGELIVYESGSNIYIMNTDGNNQKQLTYGTAQNCYPKWSPK